jgi:hypothetical protein
MLICVSVVVFAEMSVVYIGEGYSIVVPAYSTLTWACCGTHFDAHRDALILILSVRRIFVLFLCTNLGLAPVCTLFAGITFGVFFFNLVKHHAVKVCWEGCGGINPCILNRGIRWTCGGSPLLLQGIEPQFLGHHAHSLVTIPTVLSKLLPLEYTMLWFFKC